MRDAIYRFTAPILDRIPDISHQPKGRQVSIGLAASVVFHLLLLLVAVIFGMVLPENGLLHFAKSKPQLQEIEITIIPPAPALEMRTVPLEEPVTPFIDSRGLNPADKAPENPVFQSGRDMKAASESAPTGNLPLPSQEGRIAPNSPEFEQQKAAFGAGTPAPPAAMSPPTQTPPAEEKNQPDPAVAPPTTAPVAKEMPGGEKESALKPSDKPSEDEIALELKQKTAPLPKPRMRTTAPLAMLTPTVVEPPAPSEPAFQPQAEKTRVEGNISNRGRRSVDAKSTPLGRYNEAVGRAISSRWNYYIRDKGDVVALGSVRISFSVDRKGRVTSVRSEENTSNAAFAAICEKAVLDSELKPPGKDLSDALANGKLDITFTFTLY